MKSKYLLLSIISAVIGGLVAVSSFVTIFNDGLKPAINSDVYQPVRMASLNNTQSQFPDFTVAADKTVHAVVHVKIIQKGLVQYYDNPFYNFFFGDRGYYQQQEITVPSGSGVIVSSDGYIVTNNHVINGASDIEVTLNDKRTFRAKLIGADATTDIALLKIDEKELTFLSFGNSDNIKIGEWVLAVGNPFNLTSTVTAGIISAKARNINILDKQYAIESFIQTDAVVNPGNSGGALVNTNGELIGINTAIASPTGSYTGYSFAIPSTIAKKIVSDIIEFGEVQRAYLGVAIQDINSEFAKEAKIQRLEGVYVSGISETGAAKDAGINVGDIIIAINDFEVKNVAQLQEQVSKYRPGDEINITILRNNSDKKLLITLLNKNGTTSVIKTESVGTVLGARFEPISDNLKVRLRVPFGVQIVDLGDGKLKKAGVKEGFIITHVNRERIENMDDIKRIVKNSNGGLLIEGIYPNGISAYYAFGI